eukprot:9638096-Prorocentrum_lima.AAC.1
MTSSLVGSEMCIRDRLANALSHHMEKLAAGACIWKKQMLAHGLAGEVTVSYTHLTLPTICSV